MHLNLKSQRNFFFFLQKHASYYYYYYYYFIINANNWTANPQGEGERELITVLPLHSIIN